MEKIKYEYRLDITGTLLDNEEFPLDQSTFYFEKENEGRDLVYRIFATARKMGINIWLDEKKYILDKNIFDYSNSEGYNVRQDNTINRIIEYGGKKVHQSKIIPHYVQYHKALSKMGEWELGDEAKPFGEIDYSEVKILDEWVNGNLGKDRCCQKGSEYFTSADAFIVFCKTEQRALNAHRKLVNMGFSSPFDVEKGVGKWNCYLVGKIVVNSNSANGDKYFAWGRDEVEESDSFKKALMGYDDFMKI